MSAPQICFKCSKSTFDWKSCAKCKSVTYCSRECQKDDHKSHKKVCAAFAQARSKGEDVRININTKVLEDVINKPFHKLQAKTWLHSRSETDVKKLLVDSFRLRKVDELRLCKLTEIVDTEADASDGMAPFRKFVQDALKKGLLPRSFTLEKIDACVEYGLDKKNWSNLHDLWVDDQAYAMHYGGADMVIQLTLFAWQVLGSVDEDNSEYENKLNSEMRNEKA